jgi:hypothetical protein
VQKEANNLEQVAIISALPSPSRRFTYILPIYSHWPQAEFDGVRHLTKNECCSQLEDEGFKGIKILLNRLVVNKSWVKGFDFVI